MRRLTMLLTALAVTLVGLGSLTAIRAGDGLVRSTTVVDGVPITIVRAAAADHDQPGAVVVHGFAGSARLMLPFADTLAHNGYTVALPDLAGHGTSTRRIADPQSDVDITVRHLRTQAQVDRARIVLIGHSRGATAVADYASAHPDIAATVTLSLGQTPDGRPPGNLLMLYGQFEFPAFAQAARETLARWGPTDSDATGQTYGSIGARTARRADPVPGVEHVAILFSPIAHRATLDWLDAAVGRTEPASITHPVDRLWPAGLLLVGLLLGFAPLTWLLYRRPAAGPPSGPDHDGPSEPAALTPEDALGGRVMAATTWPNRSNGPPQPSRGRRAPSVGRIGAAPSVGRIGAALTAGLGGGAVVGLVARDPVLGLAVGGYAALVLLTVGLGVLLLTRPGRPRWPGWSRLGRVALLTAYATAMVAVPVHTGLTNAAPSVARLIPMLAVTAAVWVLFAAAERLSAVSWLWPGVVLAAGVGLLFALTVSGFGPGFLLLVLPLLVALLAIGAGATAILRGAGVSAWPAAFVAAPILAWTVATTLPLA